MARINVNFTGRTAMDALFVLSGETQEGLATRIGLSVGTIKTSCADGCIKKNAFTFKGAWDLSADADPEGELLLELLTSGRPVRIRSIEIEIDEAAEGGNDGEA